MSPTASLCTDYHRNERESAEELSGSHIHTPCGLGIQSGGERERCLLVIWGFLEAGGLLEQSMLGIRKPKK